MPWAMRCSPSCTVFWSRSMARMRGYGTLRRRGGAATLQGGEGVEERKEEWSAASGEEEVAMAAALRCVGCGADGFGWARRTSRAGGEEHFAPHVFPPSFLWLCMTRTHALVGDVASRPATKLGPAAAAPPCPFLCAAARLTPRACGSRGRRRTQRSAADAAPLPARPPLH